MCVSEGEMGECADMFCMCISPAPELCEDGAPWGRTYRPSAEQEGA